MVCGGVFSQRSVPRAIAEYVGVGVDSWSGRGDWWEEARRYRAVISWFSPVTRDMLANRGCVELVIARSSGFDHIDIEAAREYGVCVANQPEVITESVAEHALAGLLAAARSLRDSISGVRVWEEKGWPGRWVDSFLVYGRSVGLLGAGRIAAAFLRRLTGFGVDRVLYFSRSPKPLLEQLYGARRVGLEELFEESEILLNSLPLNSGTRGLVTESLLLRLPKNAIYINVGRGGTEQPGAVCNAARKRPDLRFVLDVHPQEPLPRESPRALLLDKPWNILTPHLAGASRESRTATTLLALMQARDYLERGCVWNPVIETCRPCRSKPITPFTAIRVARELALD